ncbi:MAG: transposase [Bdellovibrionales bacterium]|nr:transposase [Bdellovibrionales bacterium]
MRAQQLSFLQFDPSKARAFGGSWLRGNPRDQRPISFKRPLHVVLRSSQARGPRSFLEPKRAKRVRAIVERAAKIQGVKLYRYANSGNHMHLVVLARSRPAYQAFIRSISGLIARATLGAERGRAKDSKSEQEKSGKRARAKPDNRADANLNEHPKPARFWDARPFTRIIEWGRDYRRVCAYLMQNTLEALGFVPYRPRNKYGEKPKTLAKQSPRAGPL